MGDVVVFTDTMADEGVLRLGQRDSVASRGLHQARHARKGWRAFN